MGVENWTIAAGKPHTTFYVILLKKKNVFQH